MRALYYFLKDVAIAFKVVLTVGQVHHLFYSSQIHYSVENKKTVESSLMASLQCGCFGNHLGFMYIQI